MTFGKCASRLNSLTATSIILNNLMTEAVFRSTVVWGGGYLHCVQYGLFSKVEVPLYLYM